MNARHSKATPRWGSPSSYVERARTALGGRIELDPMSEAAFNAVVRAERYYTAEDDGLAQPWRSPALYLNPAGGLVVQAWRKLMAEHAAGNVQRAVWTGFSVEQLNLLANEDLHPDDFSKLTCRKRISFVRHDGVTGAPSHSNYVVGIGIRSSDFEAAFAGLGRFSHGRAALIEANPTGGNRFHPWPDASLGSTP